MLDVVCGLLGGLVGVCGLGWSVGLCLMCFRVW